MESPMRKARNREEVSAGFSRRLDRAVRNARLANGYRPTQSTLRPEQPEVLTQTYIIGRLRRRSFERTLFTMDCRYTKFSGLLDVTYRVTGTRGQHGVLEDMIREIQESNAGHRLGADA